MADQLPHQAIAACLKRPEIGVFPASGAATARLPLLPGRGRRFTLPRARRKRQEGPVGEFEMTRKDLHFALSAGASLDHEFGADRETVGQPTCAIRHDNLLNARGSVPTQCVSRVTRSSPGTVIHAIHRHGSHAATIYRFGPHLAPAAPT